MKGIPEPPEWTKGWSRIGLSLVNIEDWDGRGGILLCSRDNSAEGMMQRLIAHLQPEMIIELDRSMTYTEWVEALKVLHERVVEGSLFEKPIPKRICVLLRGMDECPENKMNFMKHLFECSVRSFICLATARDSSKIPDKYQGYIHEWRKQGDVR